jgi:ATP-binding cassette subfamily F protein 3
VLSGANVLLLDEPTNHLDIASAEMLEGALEQFEGTVLIVTHDRYLVRRLSDRVILMTPDGLVEQRDENDDLFERITERRQEKPKQLERQETDNAYLRRKESKLLRVKARQEISRIERLIEQNERAKNEAEASLSEAQVKNDYRLMQQLYETISALETEETALYDALENAERAAKAIQSEDEA